MYVTPDEFQPLPLLQLLGEFLQKIYLILHGFHLDLFKLGHIVLAYQLVLPTLKEFYLACESDDF